jgi:methylated-DNA-protein-cysteine methyltransferase-like protein
MSFSYKVFKVVRTIPKGEVMTYKEVAKFAGNEDAYRAVGNILHKNPDVHSIPCHRVVRSDLTLSKGYAFGGIKAQKKKLQEEGIVFKKNRILKKK